VLRLGGTVYIPSMFWVNNILRTAEVQMARLKHGFSLVVVMVGLFVATFGGAFDLIDGLHW
jgi:hypothetical protein